MALFLNLIVLIFEVLYYSLFMKFTRKEGKFYRYFLLFVIASIVVSILNSTTFPIYFIFMLIVLLGFKYIVKTKTSLFDFLIILLMMLLNVIIELPIFIIFYSILSQTHFITTLIFEILKLLVVYLLRDKLNIMYEKLKVLWGKNNFYIRYIFSCLIFVYTIFTIVLLIHLLWEV